MSGWNRCCSSHEHLGYEIIMQHILKYSDNTDYHNYNYDDGDDDDGYMYTSEERKGKEKKKKNGEKKRQRKS